MGPLLYHKIRFIFGKPLIASFIVGTAIHLFQALNYAVFMETNYFTKFSDLVSTKPLPGIIQILVPYLIPFLITYVANRLTIMRERESLLRFPDANPDIVIKLNGDGEVDYANPTTSQYLKRLHIDPNRPEVCCRRIIWKWSTG